MSNVDHDAAAEVILQSDTPAHLNVVWEHPTITGARLLIGNRVAANDLAMLESHNIVSVVNCCQMPNKFESTDKDNDTITYLRFPIANWRGDSASIRWQVPGTSDVRHHFDMTTHAGVLGYFEEAVAFCEATFLAGGSILVHCSAGAHRGGTAGTALLMILVAKLGGHIAAVYEDGCLNDATGDGGSARRILNAVDAVASVQQVRSIVEPVCDFKMLLDKLEAALRYKAATEEGVHPEKRDRGSAMISEDATKKEPTTTKMERGAGGGRPDMVAVLSGAVTKPLPQSSEPPLPFLPAAALAMVAIALFFAASLVLW